MDEEYATSSYSFSHSYELLDACHTAAGGDRARGGGAVYQYCRGSAGARRAAVWRRGRRRFRGIMARGCAHCSDSSCSSSRSAVSRICIHTRRRSCVSRLRERHPRCSGTRCGGLGGIAGGGCSGCCRCALVCGSQAGFKGPGPSKEQREGCR